MVEADPPGPPIDPRLRQRLDEVRRDEDRRRISLFVAAGALVLAGLLGWAVTRSPVLGARHIVVLGASHTQRADIVRAAGLRGRRQMLDLDPAAMTSSIETLPWVDTARVRRGWPTTVTITVTERTAVAAVAHRSGSFALVDRTGRVLAVVPGQLVVLPRVTTPAPPVGATPDPSLLAGDPGTMAPRQLGAALSVAADLAPPLVGRVLAVVAAPDGGISLSLVGGASAVLGPADDLAAKLTALATVLGKVNVGRGTLDVRVPGAPVLTGPPPGQ